VLITVMCWSMCRNAVQPPVATTTASESDYFPVLEDSFSSDPMLAGLAVQVHHLFEAGLCV